MADKLILLDPQSRAKLDTLGRLEGAPSVDKSDLDSAKSQKILASMPLLKDVDYGLSTPSPRNLELLRQFSTTVKKNTTLWALAQIDSDGAIQSVDTPNNIDIAQELLNNPKRMITNISENINVYATKLPREWNTAALQGGDVAVHFTKTIVDLSEVDDPCNAVEKVGPDMSHFLFDTILILKMIGIAKKSSGAHKVNARHFLSDMNEIGIPYFKGILKQLQAPSHRYQLSRAAQQGLYVFYILSDQASKAAGGPPLDFSVPLASAPSSATK